MTASSQLEPRFAEPQSVKGQKIALLGKLVGMPKRDAQQLIRQQGGIPVDQPAADTRFVVVGDQQQELLDDLLRGKAEDWLNQPARTAVDQGDLKVIGESELWQMLGLVDAETHVQRLYTPGMLANLVGVSATVIRRWQRLGLIKPAREVRRLPYFDFQEVRTARKLSELLAAGISPDLLKRRLAEWSRYLPGVERPLDQLSVIVRGQHLLLRQGDGLIDPGGQLWFDFASDESPRSTHAQLHAADDGSRQQILPLQDALPADPATAPPEVLLEMAVELEDEGELASAADLYRSALAAGGPNAEICFTLAETLYRLGDLTAARERYYMAIELDPDYVEARANLGCVLAEMGRPELAVAAFQGALAHHAEYPDARYHLARTLTDLNRLDEAKEHWQAFLHLAPDSPWADEARRIVNQD